MWFERVPQASGFRLPPHSAAVQDLMDGVRIRGFLDSSPRLGIDQVKGLTSTKTKQQQ